jgi:hypothetical protein
MNQASASSLDGDTASHILPSSVVACGIRSDRTVSKNPMRLKPRFAHPTPMI